MIVDKNGKEVEPPKEDKHKFGYFKIPDDCHIKGFSSITADKPYGWTGTGGLGYKEHSEKRI